MLSKQTGWTSKDKVKKSKMLREELLEPNFEQAGEQWASLTLPLSVSLLRNLAGISAGNTYQSCAMFPPVDYVSATVITAPFQLIASDVAIPDPLNEKHNFS